MKFHLVIGRWQYGRSLVVREVLFSAGDVQRFSRRRQRERTSMSESRSWREVLGLYRESVSRELIEAQFRALARVNRPDAARMAELIAARNAALREVTK